MTMSDKDFPKRGDIYFADLEPVEGSEQGGSRPVLIISNNIMNRFAKIVLIIPFSTKGKPGIFYVPYELSDLKKDQEGINELKQKGINISLRNGFILTSHSRSVSKDRLIGKVGNIESLHIIQKVETGLKDSFALEACGDCGIPLRPNGLICSVCNKTYRIKCLKCSKVISIEYVFCPYCGGGLIK